MPCVTGGPITWRLACNVLFVVSEAIPARDTGDWRATLSGLVPNGSLLCCSLAIGLLAVGRRVCSRHCSSQGLSPIPARPALACSLGPYRGLPVEPCLWLSLLGPSPRLLLVFLLALSAPVCLAFPVQRLRCVISILRPGRRLAIGYLHICAFAIGVDFDLIRCYRATSAPLPGLRWRTARRTPRGLWLRAPASARPSRPEASRNASARAPTECGPVLAAGRPRFAHGHLKHALNLTISLTAPGSSSCSGIKPHSCRHSSVRLAGGKHIQGHSPGAPSASPRAGQLGFAGTRTKVPRRPAHQP